MWLGYFLSKKIAPFLQSIFALARLATHHENFLIRRPAAVGWIFSNLYRMAC